MNDLAQDPGAHIAQITIELLDLWQAGSGRGAGQHLDSVPVVDAQGLPYLPGRTVKGLLRDAVRHLELIGGLEIAMAAAGNAGAGTLRVTNWLFGSHHGSEDDPEAGPQTRFNSRAGGVWVSDARLTEGVRKALSQHPARRAALFHDVYATAISENTGQAKDQSLRSKRANVPMTLCAHVESSDALQLDVIEAALPLIDALGAQRTRGLGRCVWTLNRPARH